MKTENLFSSGRLALVCLLLAALAAGCTLSHGIDLPSTDRNDTGSSSDGGAEAPGIDVGGEDDGEGAGGDCGAGGAGGATDSIDCR